MAVPHLCPLGSQPCSLRPLAILQDGPTFLIGLILAIAFIYWEGGILLRQLRARRQARERQRQQGGGGTGAAGAAGEAAGSAAAGGLPPQLGEQHDEHEHHERKRREEWTPLDRARHERRRGLGWLALATAGLIWLTGVVNNPSPFQP